MTFQVIEGVVDVLTLHENDKANYPFLLDSVAKNAKIGRYQILFYRPQQSICLDNLADFDFLDTFNQAWQAEQQHLNPDLPKHLPFRGGWFVYLSYELAAQIEHKLNLYNPPYPVAYAGRCGAAIIVDCIDNKSYVLCDLSEATNFADILTDAKSTLIPTKLAPAVVTDLSEADAAEFVRGVEKSKDYIIAGDVFQVNLSRKWQANCDNNQLNALYRQLRVHNPAPFAASCQIGDFTILSSSPERLISVRDRQIETRPIAGTRRRGENDNEDNLLSKELIGHIKERAEHVMLIDLERNDLGRICKAGTVKVDELMVIETYQHVHHIVSNVIGEIRDEITPADAIRATFPGGTITGCPKVRCMEIIAELEQTYRGAYTGSLGYVNHDGDLDLNILIRTFSCFTNKIEFRAGAGIVYDSHPPHELMETRNKAKGLLWALHSTT